MKVICTECDWHGDHTEADRVQDPRGPDTWQVCPGCRTPEHMVQACDEPECWTVVSCGTPTANGYRNTCGKHCPHPGSH